MENLVNSSPLILVLVFLVIGFAFLMKGADFFVEGSSSIAKRLKVPPIIIGLTIVAMGTYWYEHLFRKRQSVSLRHWSITMNLRSVTW